jgi:hypothetical protein
MKGMCILSVHQRIKVHYGEAFFEKCITSKPIVAIGKIAINSQQGEYLIETFKGSTVKSDELINKIWNNCFAKCHGLI